ncbi:hypothetical protein LCGC14_1750620 [marine sediment metagenome]|uniref:PLOD1-3-like GT domain-containing protein n=1 Tax=marine sediment metagenome TaxID=412755 RepID=A0A0F9H448_9ZZZZ
MKKRVFDYFSDNSGNTFYGRKEKMIYPIPKKSKTTNPMANKLTILMVSNLKEYGSAARCLEYYGIPYVVIGKDIPVFQGQEKLKKIIEFIPSVKTEYFMLLDSDDIFIVDGFEEIINTYERRLDCKMLFNAEGWSFPKGENELKQFEESVAPKDNPFKYLNSGAWISNTEFLHSIYDTLLEVDSKRAIDQSVFKELYKIFYPQIKIDYGCEYFQSVPWSTWFSKYYPGRMNLELEETWTNLEE